MSNTDSHTRTSRKDPQRELLFERLRKLTEPGSLDAVARRAPKLRGWSQWVAAGR